MLRGSWCCATQLTRTQIKLSQLTACKIFDPPNWRFFVFNTKERENKKKRLDKFHFHHRFLFVITFFRTLFVHPQLAFKFFSSFNKLVIVINHQLINQQSFFFIYIYISQSVNNNSHNIISLQSISFFSSSF